MATTEEINDKLERLIDLLSNGRFASTATVDDPAKNLKKSFTNLENAIARSNAALKVSEGTLKNQADRQKEAARRLSREIDAIDEHIELLEKEGKVSEANLLREQKREAERNKIALNQKAANKEMIDQIFDLSNVLKIAGTTMVNASTAVGGAMKNLQGTAKATDAAGTLLKAGAGLAGAAAEGLGKGLETAGNSTILASSGMKGVAKYATLAAGSLLSAAGVITTKGSPLLVKGFTFFYDFMSTEFEALGEGFRKTSSAGALFANGMTGMTQAAGAARLTLQQFGGVVERNRESLVKSGLGVSGSMALLAGTSGLIRTEGNNVGRQLNNLGYTFEQQSELIADTMGGLGRFGGVTGMSEKQVADATLETAKSMKLLAGLSGEEAKSKREATRKANDEAAFKSKLLQLEQKYGKDYAKRVEDSMSQLDANTQQMIRERVKYDGSVVSKDLAIMSETVPAMASASRELTDSILNGSITIEQAALRQGQANDQIVAQASQAGNSIEMVGMALSGPAQSMAKAFEKTFTDAIAMSSNAVKKQIASLDEAANTSDPLTKNYIAAMKANQTAMVAQQQIAMNNMGEFAGLVAKVNEKIVEALKLVSEGLGEKTIWQSLKDNILTFAGNLITAVGLFKFITSGGIGGMLGKGAAGTAAGAAGTAVARPTGGMTTAQKTTFDDLRAKGYGAQAAKGIATGKPLSAIESIAAQSAKPPMVTTAPPAAAAPAKGLLSSAGGKLLSLGKTAGTRLAGLATSPAGAVAGAAAAGYGVGSLINATFGEQIGAGIDKLTGASAERAKLLESTPINISRAAPKEKPVTTGLTTQTLERQVTQTTTNTVSELSLPNLPLNINTKEMRDALVKQIEQMSSLASLSEQMLNQLRENNNITKQLLNATV